jgi:hypothetical protein
VSRTGLTLSAGKTLESSKFFSLNSTYFQATPVRVKLIPVIRSTCFFGKIDCPQSITGRFESIKDFSGSRRRVLRVAMLRRYARDIASTQRSLRRGLGIRVSDGELKESGMWLRECFYLSLPFEPSLPPIIKTWMQNCIPPGFERFPAKGNERDDPEFYSEMTRLCWTKPATVRSHDSTDEYWSSVREGTFKCTSWIRERTHGIRRRARLLKMSLRATREYFGESLPRTKVGRPVRLVWRRAATST